MKRVVHIGARLLIAYFIALPVLFGYHTTKHQHKGEDHRDALKFVQFTSDCTLCELYHSQTAVVETPFFYNVESVFIPYESDFMENLYNATRDFNCLRGPPGV